MNHLEKYLGSLFLVAALATPVTIMAVPAPQDDREHKRVYDKEHKDYHNWDDNENHAWRQFLRKTTRVHTNTRRRTRRSSRNTGITATLIQITKSKVTNIERGQESGARFLSN